MLKIFRKIVLTLIALGTYQYSIADSIQFSVADKPEVFVYKTTRLEVYADTPKNGTGSSAADPFILYLPVHSSSGGVDNLNYTSLDFLPEIGAAFNLSFSLIFNKESEATTDKTLYASVKDSSGQYTILDQYNLSNYTGAGGWTPVVGIDNLCSVATELSNCTRLSATSTPTVIDSATLYFVIAADGLTEINPSDADQQDGFYVKLKISNKVYNDKEVILEELRKGDGELTAVYNSNFTMTDLRSVYAFGYNDGFSLPPADFEYGTIKNNGSLRDLETLEKSGEVKINELQNAKFYSFSIIFMDKYLFLSRASNEFTERPLAIEALLESQACFLLTAGFEGEHPVVDYFRYIRDRYLSQFSLGRLFIAWYYQAAPPWAHIIYQHDVLKISIRSLAWIAYWNLKLFLLPFIFFALIVITIRKTYYKLKHK